MAYTPRSTVGTVKSWNSSRQSQWTDESSMPYNMDHRPIADLEAARLRNTQEEFPWLSQEFEPLRTTATRGPPRWFRDGRAVNRSGSGRSGRSGRSRPNMPRESILDLHLIVSDMDYYAGAVHDYQQHADDYSDDEWDEEEAAGEYPSSQGSDGESFGQIQIIRSNTVKRGQSTKSKKSEKDVNLVSWDGPDDPDNPKNWTKRRKWMATITVSLFCFISPVSSSMIAPALSQVKSDLNIQSELLVELAMSIFILGFALGPLFLGPLSEIFGRRIVLQLGGMFYLFFNLAAGFSNSAGELIAFRFLSGLGGSAPLGCGGGVLADVWLPQERGRAMALYSLAPLLGPAVGPVAGGFIAQYSTWRWVFWSTSIAAGLVQLMGIFFMQETYAAAILTKKKKQLIKTTGNKDLRTEFDNPNRSFAKHLGTALQRPFRLLLTQPIVQLLALYIGYVYGTLYLVLASFPLAWSNLYDESPSIAGLNYLSLGVGFFLGTQIAAQFADKIYKNLKAQNNEKGRSEFRVPLMLPGAIMVPVGLALYGWSAQYKMPWIVPNIGTAIFAAGNQLVFQNCQTYIVDAYTRYAASAIAATAVFRSLGGFAFPLFAPAMYKALGYGWGNSVLSFAGIAVGLPVPFILWWFGESLRKRSTFAAG